MQRLHIMFSLVDSTKTSKFCGPAKHFAKKGNDDHDSFLLIPLKFTRDVMIGLNI